MKKSHQIQSMKVKVHQIQKIKVLEEFVPTELQQSLKIGI